MSLQGLRVLVTAAEVHKVLRRRIEKCKELIRKNEDQPENLKCHLGSAKRQLARCEFFLERTAGDVSFRLDEDDLINYGFFDEVDE